MRERQSRRILLVSLAVVAILTASWSPLSAQQVGPDYVIGPEDVMQILVWDNKDLDQVLFVLPDGKISVPLAGEIKAAGLTVAQLSETLAKHFSKAVKLPQVTVILREIKSQAAFFVGGVVKPGPLQVSLKNDHLQYAVTWFLLAAAVTIAFGFWLRGSGPAGRPGTSQSL